MPLTPEEEDALRKQIQQELEVEHESRNQHCPEETGKNAKDQHL